jgi:hypothetical protein
MTAFLSGRGGRANAAHGPDETISGEVVRPKGLEPLASCRGGKCSVR